MQKYYAKRQLENAFQELEKLASREIEIRNELVYLMCAGPVEYNLQDETLMMIVDKISDGKITAKEAMDEVEDDGLLEDFEDDGLLEDFEDDIER